MTGTAINVSIKDRELKQLFQELEARFGHLQPAMAIIGETVRASVQKNFEKGGRPNKWAALSDTTLARKKGGKTLIQQGYHGGLLGSIHAEVGNNSVMVGTDKIYAATHQFGAKKLSFGTVAANVQGHTRTMKNGAVQTVKAHQRKVRLPWGNIPARPFLVIQDEDWKEIEEELKDYIMIGRA